MVSTRWIWWVHEGARRLGLRVQGRVYALNDVWIRPPFGGKGRKMTGQLEAHANGFRYSSPKGDQLDIMYRCARSCTVDRTE